MGTRIGTGASTRSGAKAAVAEAAQNALAGLGGGRANFGFLFASPSFALAEGLAAAREATGADIVGCTTAGEITEQGLIHGGVALMLVSSDATTDLRFAMGLRSDPGRVARELGSNLATAKNAGAAR